MESIPAKQPPADPSPAEARASERMLGARWAALLDAGNAIAPLAGIAPDDGGARLRRFPSQLQSAAPWQVDNAKNAIADLASVLETGLTALLAASARGRDVTAPALMLWREYHAAREAIAALAPVHSPLGPPRRA